MSKKIGVFGGTFSPFHNGHLNSLLTVAKVMGLDQIRIIPARQSPNRPQIEGPGPEERLLMARIGVAGHEPLLVVDDREIKREGISYTIDTIQDLRGELRDAQLFLIIGADQFEKFDHWRSYSEILEAAELVVTTRPGHEWPREVQTYPPGVASLVDSFDGRVAKLITGTDIHFVELKDVEVSGSELRRRLRAGEPIGELVPAAVAEEIRIKGWYSDLHKKVENYLELSLDMGRILNEKNAINVVGFDLGEKHYPAQFVVVGSGANTRQTSALAEHLMTQIHKIYGFWPQNVEGQYEGRWVVVDYGALIVHIFYDFARHEYKVEDLWSAAPRLSIPDPHAAFRTSGTSPRPRPS